MQDSCLASFVKGDNSYLLVRRTTASTGIAMSEQPIFARPLLQFSRCHDYIKNHKSVAMSK